MNKMKALWLSVGVAALAMVGLACGDRTAPGSPQDTELARPALANEEVAEGGGPDVQSYPPDQTATVGNLEEELRHAELQNPVGPLQVELAAKEAATFAGLWIEWEPEFHVVVLFTRDSDAVSDLGIAFNSGTNVKENRVELYVTDPKALDAALQRANMQLPDYVEVVKVDVLATPA